MYFYCILYVSFKNSFRGTYMGTKLGWEWEVNPICQHYTGVLMSGEVR